MIDNNGQYDELIERLIRQEGVTGKIQLIKRLREETMIGLKEAKDAVEAYGAKNSVAGLTANPSGCGASVLVLVVIGVGLLAYAMQ